MRGFEERAFGGAAVILRSDLANALMDAGVEEPEAMVARLGERRRFAGRGHPALVDLPTGDGAALPVVVRAYRRGGTLRGLFPPTFFSGDRARVELEALGAAAVAGVAVARPVAAIRRSAWGVGYRAWLITEEIPDCRDLLERLSDRDGFDPRPTIEAVGRAMRRLHDAGIAVPDLHVKNVLVPDASPGTPVLIDFDRASVGPGPLPESRRLTQLFRFDRSLEKAARRGVRVTRGERARLVRGYLGDTPIERETRLRALDAHRTHLARHRRVWKLTGR